MGKHKAGLHKEVSAIFDGVPIPKNNNANGTQQPPHAPMPSHIGHSAIKARVPDRQIPTIPKFQQPVHPPAKNAPDKHLSANTTIKTARQIPWRQTWEQIKNKLFAPKPGVDATKQKAMAILVPVLAIIMIFILTQVLGTQPPVTIKQANAGPANTAAAFSNKNNEIDWQIPDPYPTTLRDPMQIGSVTTNQEGGGKLIVKGIVYSEDNPSAVIGEQIVRQGDKISGITIVKISKNSVEFEMNGKKWTQKVQRYKKYK